MWLEPAIVAGIRRGRDCDHAFVTQVDYGGVPFSLRLIRMLLLGAILRFWLPREFEPNDLLARTRLAVGHIGLSVIALVFVLLNFWQR